MAYKKIFLTTLCLLVAVGTWAAKVKKQASPAEKKYVAGVTVQATYLSNDIVHIVKYPGEGAAPLKKSYSVILSESKAQNPAFSVGIDESTGLVTFKDRDGKVLLQESASPQFEVLTEGPDAGKTSFVKDQYGNECDPDTVIDHFSCDNSSVCYESSGGGRCRKGLFCILGNCGAGYVCGIRNTGLRDKGLRKSP